MYVYSHMCVMCVCVCEYVWYVWGHECTSVQRESRGQLKSVLSYLYCGSGIEFDILKISRQALTELFSDISPLESQIVEKSRGANYKTVTRTNKRTVHAQPGGI